MNNTEQNRIDPETAVFQLVEKGRSEEAKKALYDLVIAKAKAGDFTEAERLRERIYEIDPMALTEIIRSGEIIEHEKSVAVHEEDHDTWANVEALLTSEEFNAVYHSLERKTFQPEDTIIEQGVKTEALYFINQGSLKIAHRSGDREIYITSLGQGDLIGENFFNPSVWTVSLTALTKSDVMILTLEQLTRLEELHAGLRKKLSDFYTANNRISEKLIQKGLERRKYNRFKISRKIQVIPIKRDGKAAGRGFRAEILDISTGGLAFIIRISKRENAKLLLGRKLQVVLPVGGQPPYQYLAGQCIGVQPFSAFESDYTVHLRFDTLLEKKCLQNILG